MHTVHHEPRCWREQIGSHHLEILGPQPPVPSRATTFSKKTAASLGPKEHAAGGANGAADGRALNSDPLWELLSAFAGDATRDTGIPVESTAVKRAAVTKTAAVVAVTGTAADEKKRAGFRMSSRCSASRGRGATPAASAGKIGTGAGSAAGKGASITVTARDVPLVVSVVATLHSGDGCYQEEKALLDVRRYIKYG